MSNARSVACSYRDTKHAGTPSSVLLDSFKATKDFSEHLAAQKSFDFVVDMHMMLHDMVNEQAPLQLAPTAVSNKKGVLLVKGQGEGPFSKACLRVQVCAMSESPLVATIAANHMPR